MEIIFLVLPALMILTALKFFINKGLSEYDVLRDQLRSINEIPMSDAKLAAYELIKKSELFLTETGNCYDLNSFSVSPGINELASKYSRISVNNSPFVSIDFSALRYSKWNKDFLVIGKGMEYSDVEYEVCVRKNDETIYEVASDGTTDDVFGKYTSIYHWMIAVSKETIRALPVNPTEK